MTDPSPRDRLELDVLAEFEDAQLAAWAGELAAEYVESYSAILSTLTGLPAQAFKNEMWEVLAQK